MNGKSRLAGREMTSRSKRKEVYLGDKIIILSDTFPSCMGKAKLGLFNKYLHRTAEEVFFSSIAEPDTYFSSTAFRNNKNYLILFPTSSYSASGPRSQHHRNALVILVSQKTCVTKIKVENLAYILMPG